jgi:predicted porin
VVYHITPALYLAAQYSYAFAGSVDGIDTNGWVDRIQVGAGYWLTRSILTKLEYVQERYHSFGTNTGVVDGVNASMGPGFNGVVMEVSFGF